MFLQLNSDKMSNKAGNACIMYHWSVFVKPLLQGIIIIIIIIAYSGSMFVVLGIQHEMCMRHIVICDLQGLNIFQHSTI
jgi:hypothetical protein